MPDADTGIAAMPFWFTASDDALLRIIHSFFFSLCSNRRNFFDTLETDKLKDL
jgi:hypothetical protein